MSVEFRQKSIGEYLQILKRRKWLIFLPIITMTAAIGYVVYKLPSVYESKTMLTVKPPTISDKVVQSLTNEDVTQRLQTMNKEVLSRYELEPMIAKYDLFKLERNAGLPMELIIEKMIKNIVVEIEKTDDDQKIAAFSIKYRDRSPESARNVAAELAGKYVNKQVIASTQTAEMTREFIDKQLTEAKTNLDTLEKQRLEIMKQNIDTLPDSSTGLIAQMTNASSKRDSLTKEKESLIIERGRINDQISTNIRQINTIETLVSSQAQQTAKSATRFEDTPAYAQLVQKQTELNGKLKNLLTQFREKHPDVLATKNEIEEVDLKMKELAKLSKKKEDEATKSSGANIEIQKRNIEVENKALQDRIGRIEQQIAYKEQEIANVAGELSGIGAKINTIPNVKVALEGINNQYMSAKTTYEDYLKKKNDAQLQVNRESNAQGETIRVVDAANLPGSPVAPKRAVLTGVGAGIGLVIGLLLAMLFEFPRFFRIQNIDDAKHYTGLPVLASVPPLLSHNEKVWIKRSHWLKVLVGIAVAVGIIPLVAMILQATRLFERMVS